MPVEIRIAVSGHRQLAGVERLEAAIQAAAGMIRETYAGQTFRILSCLAEGADRLAARLLIRSLPAELTVVMPFKEPEYLEDFPTEASRLEFKELKRLASRVVVAGQGDPRPIAYQAANQALINTCDLLLVVWDGEPANGPGGTAEVVEMVRQLNLPLLWIQAAEGPSFGNIITERYNPQTGR